jgi:hypothetical protein
MCLFTGDVTAAAVGMAAPLCLLLLLLLVKVVWALP